MTNPNDLIRRKDVHAIPMLGMTVTAIDRAIASIPSVDAIPTPAPNAGVVKVKPLDLSNLLKHAFMCGWYASETISSSSEYNWTEYDPTDNAAYARIMAALEPQPDPRDEVISKLVDALERIGGVRGPYGFPFPDADLDYGAFAVVEARVALAAAKAVQHG